MKTVLVGINAKYIHPSIALYQLKANTSYEVKVLEFTIKESIDKIYHAIIGENPGLIGFSCYLWNITLVTKLTRLFKTYHPHIKILLGGPEVSYDAEYFLNETKADFLIRGEGEVAFDRLLKVLNEEINEPDLASVPSLSFIRDGKLIATPMVLADLNKIKIAPLTVTDYQKRILYLESSRGCPFNCSYCLSSAEKRVRFFPLEDVVNIIKNAIEARVPVVKFLDRTFNINKKYFLTILKLIESENIESVFQFEIVADLLDKEVIGYLLTVKQRFIRFEIGIQSTNDRVNAAVNRRQDMQLLKKNILALRQNSNIELHLDLIVGLPFETKESAIFSFDEVISWRPTELQLGFLKFLRGTRMLDLVDEFGYKYHKIPPYEIIRNNLLSENDLSEIKKVEFVLNKIYNSKWFPKTLDFLFLNRLIASWYRFFLAFYGYLQDQKFSFSSYQRDTLYSLFANFLSETLPGYSEKITFLVIQDYLDKAKTRPKKWWKDFKIIEKHELLPLVEDKIKPFTKEDFYRNGLIVTSEKEIYICFFKNFTATSFLIPLH
jgi:anaerobic magnesium-protoporphyrin IX monomethyl ester cyclase